MDNSEGRMVAARDHHPCMEADVERICTFQKYELDHFMVHDMGPRRYFSKAFFLGNSEGRMVAARYHHSRMEAKLTGRNIAAYTCGFHGFASCTVQKYGVGSLPGASYVFRDAIFRRPSS